VRFTVLTRVHADQLVDRYSERKDRKEPVITPAELAKLPGA
jgi:arsenic resistance protein ArsH